MVALRAYEKIGVEHIALQFMVPRWPEASRADRTLRAGGYAGPPQPVRGLRRCTMATQAYGVRVCHARKGGRVGEAIAKVEGVKSAHACWGLPDVIALVEAPNHKTLGRIVLQKVRRAPGVEATDTRIIVEARAGERGRETP
jgi:DNA-binding Lrp family transcriptional regulator